ncbi:MAG: tRNA (adenosine(37)-N6)-threonylcarbamoyltransferase complex ATPase subunit type 1 TsaE [Nitrospirae bacterium]|nr:tRNA (adenosine(37)-N6)-threonylcarbamoyltransferase complex ATPase subunit type 1 TsaE [Nitrospirota bacterium]
MKLLSKSESETRDIGARLGKKLKRGDVVCLYGELGSGKTTMVKGVATAFGIREKDITSASFTIIAEYDVPVPFYHIDLYRVTHEDISSLGLHEYLGADGVSVIEWAERAESEIPEKSIKVRLSHIEDNLREIEIEGIEI